MKYFSILLSMATLSSYALPTYLSSDPGFFISPSNNVQLGAGAYPENSKSILNGLVAKRVNGFSIWGTSYYIMQSKVFSTHPIIGCSLGYHLSKETNNQGAWNIVNSAYGISATTSNLITHEKTISYTIDPIIGLQYPITNRLLVNFELNPISFNQTKQHLHGGNVSVKKSWDYNHLTLRLLYRVV